jgi:hypothetical protein
MNETLTYSSQIQPDSSTHENNKNIHHRFNMQPDIDWLQHRKVHNLVQSIHNQPE